MIEQTMNRQEIISKIKPLLKKWWVWLIAISLIVFIIVLSTGTDKVQEDLLNYVNDDCVKTDILYSEVYDLYEKARNSKDDETMYIILFDEVIPKSRELVSEVESVHPKTTEVKEIHDIYIDLINKQDQAYTLLLSALENQDFEIINQANEKLDEARKMMRNYESELQMLAEEHNVELTFD